MRTLTLSLCLWGLPLSTGAQLVQWDFENITQAVPSLPIAASYLAPSMEYGHIGLSGGQNNGSPTVCFGENSWATNFWTIEVYAVDNYYMEFSTGPVAGFSATLTGFSMYFSKTSTYSANKFDVYISTDNFQTRTYIGTDEILGEACQSYFAVLPQPVSVNYGEQFAIRVYPYRQFSRFQAATIRVDNISIEGSALPVRLGSFVCAESDAGVLLQWQTLVEDNSDRFEIERRIDGTEYRTIGKVKAAGTSRQNTDYQFIDRHPLPGLNYYRLKQVDYNGITAFLGELEAEVRSGPVARQSFSLVTNTGNGEFLFRILDKHYRTKLLRVFAMGTGRAEATVVIPEGSLLHYANLGFLAPGMYWVYDVEARYGERLVVGE